MKRVALLAIVLLVGCRDAAPAASRLQLALSSTHVRAGDAVQATITAVDDQGRRVRDFRGTVRLTVDAPADLPGPLAFDAASAGQLQTHVRFLGAGKRHLGASAGHDVGAEVRVEVDAADPAQLVVASGDGQSAIVGTALPQPLVVQVRDTFGNPAPGAQVTFSGPAGSTLEPIQAVTDAKGDAATHATLGPAAGQQDFTASVGSFSAVLHANALAKDAATLVLVSGDGQVAAAGAQLAQPLVVRAIDANGNSVSGAEVSWSASRGAIITPARSTSGADGTAKAMATLPSGPFNAQFVARLGATSVTFHGAPTGLSYSDPPSDEGSIRLEYVGPGSTPGSLQLRLVAAQAMSGFAVGFDLPVHGAVSVADFTPGVALPAGASPVAAKAVVSTSGPLAGMLVAAQSQKRAGAGAVASDSNFDSGAVFFTLSLAPVANASPGVLFDGQDPQFSFSAGLLNFAGNEVVGPSGFAVGRLELH